MQSFPHRLCRAAILAACLLLTFPLLSGQTLAGEARHDAVGLVLSGGGARGFAHIGVIQALEEHGIAVSVVTGTSMGAIVGALYASGSDVERLQDIARTTHWAYAFDDRAARTDQPYIYRQLDAENTAHYRIPLQGMKVVLPRGVLQGQHLTQILDELFFDVDRIQDFDQLPIPFRAVAADLVSGEEVILDSGRLSTAVRASMSIPGLFEPVDLEGRLLVDGGIANNMPVSLARELGAGQLVVVDVGTPGRGYDQLGSVVEVMDQLTGILVRASTARQREEMREGDIYVQPRLEDITNSSFGDADLAMRAGYEAAIRALVAAGRIPEQALVRLEQLPPPARQPYVAPSRPVAGSTTARDQVIEFIQIDNDGPVGDDVIRNLLRQRIGAAFDAQRLHEDIATIYGLDFFREIRYQLVEQEGRTGLLLVCKPRAGSNFLRMSFRLSDDFRGQTDFGLGAALRFAGLNRLGGTLHLRGDLGTVPTAEARFVQPLDARMKYFIEPRLSYRSERIDVFSDGLDEDPAATYRRMEWNGGLFLGRQWHRRLGEMRVGWVKRVGELDRVSGERFMEDARYHDSHLMARLGWDSLDNLAFPRHGVRWHAEVRWFDRGVDTDAAYRRYLGELTWANSWGNASLLLEGDFSLSSTDENDLANIEPIGGFLQLSGLSPRSQWGTHRVATRLVGLWGLDAPTPLPRPVPVYLGASLELGNVWAERSDIRLSTALWGGSVFLGADTPMGPAYLSVGYTEGGYHAVNLFMGHLFR